MNTKSIEKVKKEAVDGLLHMLSCPVTSCFMKTHDKLTNSIQEQSMNAFFLRTEASKEQAQAIASVISDAADCMQKDKKKSGGMITNGKLIYKYTIASFASVSCKIVIGDISDIDDEMISLFDIGKKVFYAVTEKMTKSFIEADNPPKDVYDQSKKINAEQLIRGYESTQKTGNLPHVEMGMTEISHRVIATIMCCPVVLSYKERKTEVEGAFKNAYTIAMSPSRYDELIPAVESYYNNSVRDAHHEREEYRAKGGECCDQSMSTHNLIAHALYGALRVAHNQKNTSLGELNHQFEFLMVFEHEHKKMIKGMMEDPDCEVEPESYEEMYKSNLDNLEQDSQQSIEGLLKSIEKKYQKKKTKSHHLKKSTNQSWPSCWWPFIRNRYEYKSRTGRNWIARYIGLSNRCRLHEKQRRDYAKHLQADS
tara:strand:+ start:445 stop:1716 length:1272 start_codon:yes stop_codon:yes gene_type:complete